MPVLKKKPKTQHEIIIEALGEGIRLLDKLEAQNAVRLPFPGFDQTYAKMVAALKS